MCLNLNDCQSKTSRYRPMYMSPMVKDPSIDEWIKKMGCVHTHTHTHTGVLLNHKNEILPFATMCMDLGNTMFSEISQRQILYNVLWHLKHNTNECIC